MGSRFKLRQSNTNLFDIFADILGYETNLFFASRAGCIFYHLCRMHINAVIPSIGAVRFPHGIRNFTCPDTAAISYRDSH